MTDTIRLGRLQRDALRLVATHDGSTFDHPAGRRPSPSAALAFDHRMRRLQSLGLIEDYAVTAWISSLDEMFAGSLGAPAAFRASLTPKGRALVSTFV